MKASTAIIGLGKIGLTYDLNPEGKKISNQIKTHCRAVSLSEHFKVSLLFDLNPIAVKLATAHYGGQGFKDLTDALEQENPELVIVSVPTHAHLKTIRSINHIWTPNTYLIEKPFGYSTYEAEVMSEILYEQDCITYVNYMRRYLPNVINLKASELFKERGTLRSVKILGYGTLINIFSHFFDLLIFLEGAHILGLSKKIIKQKTNSNYKFREPSNGVYFEFSGIGKTVQECEMSLEYDSFKVNLLSNGKVLKIFDHGGLVLGTFEISDLVFNSYQSFVLNQIATDIELRNSNNCILNAIHIHRFIESI